MTAATVDCPVHFPRRGWAGARVAGHEPAEPIPAGRVPRAARLMALALHFDRLLRAGGVTNRAELARLGGVTRARVTQVLGLLHLAPDLQAAVLNLPRVRSGRDPVTLRHLLPVTAVLNWDEQRARAAAIWKKIHN